MSFFSVIMPTRNRPALFATALASVLGQSETDIEVIVVMDGSDPVHDDAYRALEQQAAGRARVIRLPPTRSGHGSSHALNQGAAQARGAYLCFLDDDDLWTDPDHLRHARAVLAGGADLYLCDQEAWAEGEKLERAVWIEDLRDRLDALGEPDEAGSYAVTPGQLLRCQGFCHLNTTIVRRALFEAIGGLDDNIRYENDRDFFLRAIDRARAIRYGARTVARHNVPDPAGRANLSTEVSALERLLFQLRVFDKSQIFAHRQEIAAHARVQKGYVLRRIAMILADNHPRRACPYAREALGVRFSLKWLAFSLRLHVRALGYRGTRAG